MRLSRRDAVAALAAVGVAGGGVALLPSEPDSEETAGGQEQVDAAVVETMVAAAEVLYPSRVGNVEAFVERYVRGRTREDRSHAEGVADAVAYLDAYADSWRDATFTSLDTATREAVLRGMRADTAEPDPAGSDVERVRYYVVNELLFALYASPTGAELVGLENPQGHPGGLASYQRGPRS